YNIKDRLDKLILSPSRVSLTHLSLLLSNLLPEFVLHLSEKEREDTLYPFFLNNEFSTASDCFIALVTALDSELSLPSIKTIAHLLHKRFLRGEGIGQLFEEVQLTKSSNQNYEICTNKKKKTRINFSPTFAPYQNDLLNTSRMNSPNIFFQSML